MAYIKLPSLVIVVLLWLAGLGASAQFAKVSIVFAELQMHYDQFGTASGLLLSIISFLGIIFGLAAGMLGTKIGHKRLLIIGLLLGASTSLAQTLLPPFYLMLLLRVIEGASHLAIVVATPTLIAQISPLNWRGFSMTLWGTFFGVSFALMSIIAPPLLSAGGVPALFLAHSVFMTLMSILVYFAVPRITADMVPDSMERLPKPGYIKAHISAYQSPFISAPAIGWGFYTATFVSTITILPRFMPEDQRLWLIAAMPMASIIVSLTLGVALLRFMSAVGVVITGFWLSAIAALLMVIMGISVPLILALFAAMGLIQGATFAAVPQLNAQLKDRALANGLMAQTGNIGNILGTPVIVFLLSVSTQTGIIYFCMACYIIGAIWHMRLSQKRDRQT